MKIAIVTGAGSGIGKAVALTLARADYAVVLAGRRRQALDSVVGEAEAAGGRALAVASDVTDPASVKALFETARKTFGRLDLLFNNAGTFTPAVPMEEITTEQWQAIVATNLSGAFYCTQQAFRMMKAQTPQGGRIINVGSVSAKTPRPDSLPYTVTKFGLQGMTHQLTMDGRKHNIVASIIHPGATLSSFTTRRGRTKSGHGEKPEDYVMAAEDVAKVAVLMAALPGEVNLYEATILPNHMKSFIGRG